MTQLSSSLVVTTKFDIPATVKTTTPDGVDIVNTANQVVHQYDPTKKTVTTPPKKDTQKRVVNLPISLPLNFTKRLDGRQLQANEFTFELRKDGVKVADAQNDAPNANGVAKINFKALQFTHDDLGKTYTYTVNEVAGSDATVTYDTMVATITVTIQKMVRLKLSLHTWTKMHQIKSLTIR